jgi:hypothetical protein
MEYPKANINKAFILRQTNWTLEVIEARRARLNAYDLDQLKEDRLIKKMCKYCYYLAGSCAGAAMTQRECAFCNNIVHSGSTDINVMCKDCATKYRLCVHCGSDIELKLNRKNLK